MTNNAYRILTNNYECKSPSLLYDLHERDEFHSEAFWEYYDAVVQLTKDKQDQHTFDRDEVKLIVFTSQAIMSSWLYHLNPSDGATIRGLTGEEIQAYHNRLTTLIDGYFNEYIVTDEQFDDGLRSS